MKRKIYHKKTGMYVDWEQISQLPDIDNFIDIGVGAGTFDLWKKYKNKRIICIDPLEKSEKIVSKKLKGKNYLFHRIALGSKTEHKYLNIEKNFGRSSLLKVTQKNYEGKPLSRLKVKIEKLDEILKKDKLKGSFGIKIDVEGYEFEVLKGAKKTLLQTKFLIIEVRHNHISFKNQYKLHELIDFLTKNNFILTNIFTAKPFIADLCFQSKKFLKKNN